MQVLVAIEPRSYREAIATAIQKLRPHLKTTIAEPEELARTLAQLNPQLVICDQPNTLNPDDICGWVEFRPYAQPAAKVCVGARRWELDEVSLEDLLWVIDEVKRLG